MAKRISVINFKGGVGKSTFAFQFACGLTRYHQARVLLVDVDHQSSLSIVCLTAHEWSKVVKDDRTVTRIFRSFVGSGNPFPDASLIYRDAVKQSYSPHYEKLDLVPASLQLDDIEIDLTASHQGNAIHSEWNKRTLICRWIEETNIDQEYDYIIFDCPPATKIVSQNAIAASHGYIVPVIPEAVMERGAPHLAAMIETGIDSRLNALASMGDKRKMFVPKTNLVGVVVTRIKAHGPAASGYTDDHTEHLGSLRRRWKKFLVEPYIVDGTGVSQSLSQGVPVYDMATTQNVGGRGLHRLYRDVTAELKKRVDTL